MKGLMEVLRKRGRSILGSPLLSLGQKVLAIDFFLVLSLQPLFMIVGHLSIIPSYYCLERLGYPGLVGWITLGLLALLSATHLSFLCTGLRTGLRTGPYSGLRSTPAKINAEHRTLWRSAKDKLLSVALIPALFVALTCGLLEGMLRLPVHRDRTIKVAPSGTGGPPGRGSAQWQILARINGLEIVMGLYSIIMVGWAFWQREIMVGLCCGLLALCYPWNALISYRNLKLWPRTGSQER